MGANWRMAILKDMIQVNPMTKLAKGTEAKKIGMDVLKPFCRDVPEYTVEKYSGGAKFINGDTIMARITPCLENGKTSQIRILAPGEVGFGSTEYVVFRAKEGLTDPDYVYYLVTSSEVRDPAIKSMVGSSGRQRVQNEVVENLELNFPDIQTQKQIASVLKTLDDKIELNRKMNANLEAMAQALFKSWFVDFEPFGGQMPEGWKETPLVDLADFVGGYSYTSSELQASDCAMATIKNFDRNGGFKLDGYKEIVPSPKLKDSQRVDLFDILVAHTDLTQNAEVIGNAEMVLSRSGYKSLIMSTDLVKVLPKSGVSRFVLAGVLKYAGFKGHALGYVNGTTVLHMSKKALPEYMLPYPEDPSVLVPLAESAEAIYRKIALNLESSRTLAQLRDTLLPKLMSGELNVDDVKID